MENDKKKISMIVLVIVLLLSYRVGKVEAGDGISCHEARERLYQRTEDLERENLRLVNEISRLRNQIYQDQKLRSRSRSPYGYSYGQSPLSGATRQMDELNRARRSWDNLKR